MRGFNNPASGALLQVFYQKLGSFGLSFNVAGIAFGDSVQ
jgi:hypothetical protein